MTRVQEIKRQIERDEYDETDPKKLKAVVKALLCSRCGSANIVGGWHGCMYLCLNCGRQWE